MRPVLIQGLALGAYLPWEQGQVVCNSCEGTNPISAWLKSKASENPKTKNYPLLLHWKVKCPWRPTDFGVLMTQTTYLWQYEALSGRLSQLTYHNPIKASWLKHLKQVNIHTLGLRHDFSDFSAITFIVKELSCTLIYD